MRIVTEVRQQAGHGGLACEAGQVRQRRSIVKTGCRIRESVAEADPGGRVADAITDLRHREACIQVVGARAVFQSGIATDAVIVEIDRRMHGAGEHFQAVVEPVAHVAGKGAMGSVVGAKSADNSDVRAPKTGIGLVGLLVDEHQHRRTAESDCRLGDGARKWE